MPSSTSEQESEHGWTLLDDNDRTSEVVSLNTLDAASLYSDETWSMIEHAFQDENVFPLSEANVHPDELRDIERAIRASLADAPPPSFVEATRDVMLKRKRPVDIPPQYTRSKILTRDVRAFPTMRPVSSSPTTQYPLVSNCAEESLIPSSSASTGQEMAAPQTVSPTYETPLILQKLPQETICLVMDQLYFPDLFSLALSCRGFQRLIDLRKAKLEYLDELRASPVKQYTPLTIDLALYSDIVKATSRKFFCDVCLYHLDQSYFDPGETAAVRTSIFSGQVYPPYDQDVVCMDCKDIRARIAREQTKTKEELANWKGHGNTLPVWRRSQKVWIKGKKGDLWYRDRL